MQPAALDDEIQQPPKRTGFRRRIARTAAIVCLTALLGFGGFLLRPFYSQNIGIVDPGGAIRSAQPTWRLDDMIREYKLATILNLRGGSPDDAFYANEVRAAEAAGVSFLDLPLSATRRPKRRELLMLIDAIAGCGRPVLIHCKSGADRTGLASAVYRMVVLGEPPERAIEEFTIFHSHIPLFGPQHLHEPINEYEAWLADQGLSHAPDRFRDWVKNDYKAEDPSVDPPPLPAGPRHERRAVEARKGETTDHHSG